MVKPTALVSWSWRRSRLLVAGAVSALVLYAAFGYFIAPRIIRSQIVQLADWYLGCRAEVGRIRVHPFRLAVRVEDFRLTEPGGSTLASFSHLFVNVNSWPLLRGTYAFDEIWWKDPRAELVLEPDGRVNVARLAAEAPAARAPAEPGEAGGAVDAIPSLRIGVLHMDGGSIDLEDRARPKPFRTQVGPLRFVLRDFATRVREGGLYSFRATTDKGTGLDWEGTLHVGPSFASEGRVVLTGISMPWAREYLGSALAFEVPTGVADAEGRYELDLSGEAAHLVLSDGAVKVRDLAIAGRAEAEPCVQLPQIEASGATVDLAAREARVAHVLVRGARANVILEPDGAINLLKLVAEPAAIATPGVSPSPKAPEWKAAVEALTLEDATVSVEDRAPVPPASLIVTGLAGEIRALSLDERARPSVKLSGAIEGGGPVSAEGTVEPSIPGAELAVEAAGVPLMALRGYVEGGTNVRLVRGSAGVKGRYRIGSEEGRPVHRYDGEASVTDVQFADGTEGVDLVGVKSLAMTGVALDLVGPALRVADAAVDGFAARAVLSPDGTLNLQRALSPPGQTPGTASDGAPGPAGLGGFQASIKTTRVRNSSVDLEDGTLQPPFRTRLQDLEGALTDLSTDPAGSAALSLKGKADAFAAATLEGTLQLFAPQTAGTIDLTLRDYDCTAFTPYMSRYAGYVVERGKLTASLHYALVGRQISGQHKLLFDRFTLGHKTESPDATNLPVKLGIALLTDRHGKIDLDLGVQGSLDEPGITVRGLIGKMIKNIFVKVAMAPFSLFAKLFGREDEELNRLLFLPGEAEPGDQEMEKLDKVAKGLEERPAVRLGIRGAAGGSDDRRALAEKAMDETLRRARMEEIRAAGQQPPARVQDVALEGADVQRLMLAEYRARYGEDPLPPPPAPIEPAPQGRRGRRAQEAPPPPPAPAPVPPEVIAHVRGRLLSDMTVGDEELRVLAEARARRIQAALVNERAVEAGRVFVEDPAVLPLEAPEVMTELTLSVD